MKKKIFALAAVAALFTGAVGVAAANSIPVYASEDTQVEVAPVVTTTNLYRTIPDSLVALGEFDYGGLHYSVSGNYFTCTAVSNPAEVTVLVLNYYGNKSRITYSESIDWSQYTNLQDVIVTGNTLEFATNIITALPSGTNLYLGGGANIGANTADTTFKNVYYYATYDNSFYSLTCDDFRSFIQTSRVENIYYNKLYADHGDINELNALTFNNGLSDSVQVSLCETWTYPEELFYVIPSFDINGPLFECDGYYGVNTNSTITSMSSFSFYQGNISDSVINLDCSELDYGSDVPSQHKFGVVYFPLNKDYTFSHVICDELVIRAYGSTELDITNFNAIKAVRFVKGSSSMTLAETTLGENADLEKIYIPTDHADKFTCIAEREDLASMVEYYDLDAYEIPTNTYLSEDGNTYGVKDSNLTIEQIENAKTILQTVGLETPSGTVIDEMMNYYEFPILDYSTKTPLYTVRPFDTIVLPKNMDATKVLEAFEFLISLNYGYMCDSSNASIEWDATDYVVGYNSSLPITVTLPDNTQVTQTVSVRVMNNEDDIAYILDGNDVYIITNPTDEENTLASLMAPFMEYHLMETQVEYDESPIFNSTNGGFLAGNSYTATLSNGKAKLVVSDVELIETDNTTPDTGDNDNADSGDTDTGDNVQDGSIVMKEITVIYTPESVDGSRLMSPMRDILCTVNGEVYDDYGFAIGTSSGRTNKEDYSFTAWTKIMDSYEYDETIPVKIINFDYDMGFVVFADGDIAVIFNANKDYTNAQIETAIKAFLTSQELNAESVVMPTDSIILTKTYEGSYEGGTIYIINSGVNVAFSSSSQAVDQSALKEGYVALNKVIYTKGFTMEDAMRALGKNILLKDGKLVADKFTIEYVTKEDSKYVTVTFKSGETELLKDTFYFQEVESEYSYIFAHASEFDYGYLVMDKQSKAPEFDINDVMLDIIPRFRGLLTPFATETVVDFTKAGSTDIDGIYQVGNGSYYEYEYNVEIANIESLIRTNDVVVDGNGPVGETVSDKLNDFFDDFKTRFEENKAFKAATIALGSITGILLIYGIYVIIKKIARFLRRR